MPRGDLAPKIDLAGVGKTFVTRDREVEALQPIDLTILDRSSLRWSRPSNCDEIDQLLNPDRGPTAAERRGGVVAAWSAS